jgi:hypothetical protein
MMKSERLENTWRRKCERKQSAKQLKRKWLKNRCRVGFLHTESFVDVKQSCNLDLCIQAMDSVRRQIEEDRAMKREKLAKQALAPAATATAPPSSGAQPSVQSTGLSLLQVSA